MQVEVPPWVTQWLSAAEWRRRQRERDRRMPGLTLYAYGPYGRDPPNPVQPVFRISGFPDTRDGVLGPRFGAGAGVGPGAGTGANSPEGWVPLHYPLDPFIVHSPNGLSNLPLNMHGTHPQRVNVEWVPAGTPRAPRAPPAADGGVLSGRAALRAWVFGSALIVLAIVLVRAIDKCLTIDLFKCRRRSQEWPAANVHATSRQATDISTVMIPESEGDEPRLAEYSDVLSVDLPPPYSECAAVAAGAGAHIAPGTSGHKLPDYEDPPPAYSDTYVEFSNKNGVPSVLIYSRRRTPLVNRRDIIASESALVTDDGATSSYQNAQTTDIEIINGVRDVHRELVDEARYLENNTNNASYVESLNANDVTLRRIEVDIQNNTTGTDSNLVVNSNQITLDAGGNINIAKDGEIMV